MELDFTWINLLILFGATQGLIFAIILFFNRKHPGAKFLGVFMLVLAYNGFETFNWSSGLGTMFFDFFPFVVIYAAGPSLYLYVTSLLHPENRISRKSILVHYSPAIAQFVIRAINIVYLVLFQLNILRGDFTPAQMDNVYWMYAEPVSVTVFLIYLVATIRAFRKTATVTSIKFLSKEGQQVIRQWIKALLFCMAILGICWPLTVLAPHLFKFDTSEYYYPIELALVLFIYWIAMTGYHRTKMIFRQTSKTSGQAITDTDAEEYLRRLRQAMERDRLFLDPELNLNKVAIHTGISAKTISAILNQHAQLSFNDFINHYRVTEVKERLMSPHNQHLTISGIALDSGFNSQATFQRAFKSLTGVSPREYMTLQLKKTG